MPLLTMASACARTIGSLTSLAKWFQLFQPIGGVAARFTVCAASVDSSNPEEVSAARKRLTKMCINSSTQAIQDNVLLFLLITQAVRDGIGCLLHQGSKSGDLFCGNSGDRTTHTGTANHLAVGIKDGSCNTARAQHRLFVVEGVTLQMCFCQVLLQLAWLRKRPRCEALKCE